MSADYETYEVISSAFWQGTFRLWHARETSLSLQIALLSFHGPEREKLPTELLGLKLGTVLNNLSPSHYEAYARITAASHLVYATALFDSFLTDTTRFLLLREPLKLGNRSPVSWETFLNVKARLPTITEAVTRRVREIAFWPFLRRIEFLNKTFDTQVTPDNESIQELNRFASIRNAIVHDHALYEPVLDDEDHVTARPRKPSHHDFDGNDVGAAIRTYSSVTRQIFVQVCERVLGAANEPAFRTHRDAMFRIEGETAESVKKE